MLLIYIITAILCIICLTISKVKRFSNPLIWIFTAVQISMAVVAAFNYGATELSFFTYDSVGVLLTMALAVVSIPAVIHSNIYLEEDHSDESVRRVYYPALVLLQTALTLGFLSNHIALTWVFTEITTLSAALLIFHHRDRQALEGTWKYVFVCAISISFVFIGILFISLSLLHAGSVDLSYDNLRIFAPKMDQFWLRLGFIFMLSGYSVKMGLFPMYTAGIDAKDNAPAPSAALLASVLVNLGFLGIFRAYSVVHATGTYLWANWFMGVIAMVTLFLATVYIIKVDNIKRLLAYSGIEQMAIVLLGLIFGPVGCFAALLHLIMHTFIKSGLFFHFTQLYRVYQTKMISGMGQYVKYNTFGAMVLILGFFCIIGVPPSGLFVTEFMIFASIIKGGAVAVMIAASLLLTVLIWAFSKNMFRLFFLPSEVDVNPSAPTKAWESLTQLALFLLAIYIGLNPPAFVVDFLNDAVALIY